MGRETFTITGFGGIIKDTIAWKMRCDLKVRFKTVIFVELDVISEWRDGE